MHRRRTGRTLHDPAWHGRAYSRRRSASGNGLVRAHGNRQCRHASAQTSSGPQTLRNGAAKRLVRIDLGALPRRSRHRRRRPPFEIPIAGDCGPRVPSSGTFVRLPAPETLHGSRQSATETSSAGCRRLATDLNQGTCTIRRGCQVVAHPDSAAILKHWRLTDPYIAKVMDHCEVVEFQIHGEPSAKVLQRMRHAR